MMCLTVHPAIVGQAQRAKYVDEIMRYCPSVIGTVRVAICDTTIGDVAVPAGTFVMMVTGAANRDPAVFVEPDRFDITRDGPAGYQPSNVTWAWLPPCGHCSINKLAGRGPAPLP